MGGRRSDLSPDLALFVGGFVGLLFWLAAGLAFLAGGGGSLLGFVWALVAMGAGFLGLGAVVATLLWLWSR